MGESGEGGVTELALTPGVGLAVLVGSGDGDGEATGGGGRGGGGDKGGWRRQEATVPVASARMG